MVNLRSGINRHLQAPPYNRDINLMKDTAFQTANRVVIGQIKKNVQELTKSDPVSKITQEDKDQIYEKYFLPNMDHPEALQHKVFFDLAYYMRLKNRETLRYW